MNSGERYFDTGDELQSAETAFAELKSATLSRWMEVVARQSVSNAFWYTNGFDPSINENCVAFRLVEGGKQVPHNEVIDVILPVEPNPLGTSGNISDLVPADKGYFFVRKPYTGKVIKISEANSLSVTRQQRRRIRRGVDISPISDLLHKISGNEYEVFPIAQPIRE